MKNLAMIVLFTLVSGLCIASAVRAVDKGIANIKQVQACKVERVEVTMTLDDNETIMTEHVDMCM